MTANKLSPTSARYSPRWVVLQTIVLVATIALILWLLNNQVRKSHDSELLITQLEGQINQLSAHEWQAIAYGSLSTELTEAIEATETQLSEILPKIATQADNQPDLKLLLTITADYQSAFEGEIEAIQNGDIEKARAIDEEKVDPIFVQLGDTVGMAAKRLRLQVERINTIANLLSFLLVMVAIVTPSVLVARYQNAKHSVDLAKAEQEIQLQTQSQLEQQVRDRTEELRRVNQSLLEEVTQRKSAEAALQQSKDMLEDLVAKRTEQLEAANQQLNLELTERKRVEVQINASLQEKEVLLKEVHHRVKNNLQVISSLLFLQSDKVKDAETLSLFRDSQNRIRSIALIHEKLYQSKDLAQIDLNGYIQSLVGHLQRSYGERESVQLHIQVNDVKLSIDQAMPCGMIINELVSNALKHAFPDRRQGDIFVEMSTESDERYRLSVRDTGIGFSLFDKNQESTTLGLQLVQTLVDQLNGVLNVQTDHGTEFIVHF